MNIPNQLTALRVVLIPVVVLSFFLPGQWGHSVAGTLFIIAAITDWADGYLARKYDQTTPFGAFLDPVADKLMVAAVLVLLVQHFNTALFTVPAIVIISREILISALREWMAELGERANVAVSQLGKIKTTAQMTAIIIMLLAGPAFPEFFRWVGYIALYLAAGLTLWSMVLYLQAAKDHIHWREQERKK